MSEIDYNDGNWHGWNGGKCPVHEESMVEVQFRDQEREGERYDGLNAGSWNWRHYNVSCDIITFRVIKPYVEPREWFANEYEDGFIGLLRSSENEAFNCVSDAHGQLVRTIRVREVLE